jgi:phosphoribosylamine--glycine ligase
MVDAFVASVEGSVSDGDFKWSADPAVCVVVASGGYPGAYEVGKPIEGLAEAAALPGVEIFHAGTSFQDGRYYTTGGRVLGVTARGLTLQEAVDRAYEAAARIRFEGMHYRKDIARRGLRPAAK